ncbi:CPBP family intramembrane glutamic endopeptidase [Paenibacillus thermotolerans]|uniref:CPBP family intramembrane glutamic endopeptidase n=1 Tax=Paenibacillus thermotolerans TaxID=3027807 RepID=UPI002368A21E|nr:MULTISPECIES: CPBP family intramembrane glutamic endopeptidase [unclassified Paenibacillus]
MIVSFLKRIDKRIWLAAAFTVMILVEFSRFYVVEMLIVLPLVMAALTIAAYRDEIRRTDLNMLKQSAVWKHIYYSLIVGLIVQAIGIVFVRYVVGIDTPDPGFVNPVAAPLISVLFSSPLEEVMFRYILYNALNQRYGFWPAAIASSLLFAVGHFNYAAWLGYFLLGIVWCYFYKKSGTLFVPVVSHMLFNFMIFFARSF